MEPALLSRLLLQVMAPLALLVGAGALWPRFNRDVDPAALRGFLSRLVFNLFLPPLLFASGAGARMGTGLFAVPLLLALGIGATGALLYGVLYRSSLGVALARPTRAALMLGGMFGNVFFIGYPVLSFVYGSRGGSYAAFADMMAATPLVWTLGVWIATRLGPQDAGAQRQGIWRAMLRLPPLWGFVAGAAFNALGWAGAPLVAAAHWVGQPAVPLMMFVLGLAIPWHDLRPGAAVLGVVTVKLALMPLLVWGISLVLFQAPGEPQAAVVVEAGMPTMLMAILFADRFRLDARAAALMVGWSTLLSWLTLPLWLWLVR